ncbi:MAG: PrsW family intramembrane metalloprotease [Nitrospinae bacterium]|nr:PrsW family intramembrane metalloprotease [Nitrospinota bacterium]MBL7019308.1 PrsW family intramembrane metalloprotease [Nitrospinaceae bacterium]
METLRLLYIAMGPGIAIAVFIYYSNKLDREPGKLVLKSFFLGGLAVFPTYYFEGVVEEFLGMPTLQDEHSPLFWPKTIFYAFFGVALAEELCKFLFLKAFIFDDREFNEPFDGIIYGGMIGCGFATVENIIHVLPHGQEVGILRMLTAVPGHAFFGIILGYFMGRAKFSLNGPRHLMHGLAVVVMLHGIYDTAAFSNALWSIYLIFAITFLVIYLGLKAKRELEKLAAVIEFSAKQYSPLKGPRKKVPLHLRDIRCLLSKGKLIPEDNLIDKKSGKIKSIREIFSSKIISQYKGLPKTPFSGLSVKLFLIFYQMTFGLYLYFWFLGNYRDFTSYKKLKLNPELLALGLFIFTILPYFFYGVIQNALDIPRGSSAADVFINLIVAGIESAFLYFQFKMFSGFLKKKLAKSFSVPLVILSFFILSALKKVLSPTVPFYLFWEMVLILFQGGVLALVQRDLNLYWKLENERNHSTH